MDNQQNIQDELKGMNSELPVNDNQMPFSLPEGYFDGLAGAILAKIKEQQPSAADELRELSPFLASLSKEMPYALPNGYFEENLTALPSTITETESPVLVAIGRQLPYGVPAGYFEGLPQQVLSRVQKPAAIVVPLFGRRWMRAAVAAAIAGVVFIGGYQFLNKGSDNRMASKPSVDTTTNWVASNDPSVVQSIRNVSTREMDDFIKAAPVNPTKLEKPATAGADPEIKDLLKGVSKSEIDAFLDQIPTAEEDLAVID